MLAGAGVAALLLGAVGMMNASTVSAESPPAPPARFAGTVTVDGAPVAAGTVIQAKIGSASCGVATATSDSRYVLDVPALDPGATPNCGAEGAVVSFWIGDKLARETGTWKNYDINVLNLTYVTPTPTATPTTPATGGGSTTPVVTPKAPVTGTGVEGNGGNDATLWVLVALGAGVLAFGVSGAAVARRSR
jgi:hypothetical protein